MPGYNRSDPMQRLWWTSAIIGLLLFGGTMGYMILEGYTLLDAIYMTVITLSSVGYGEVQTLSPIGRVFTTILIFCGVGTLAYGISQIAELLIEGKLFIQQRREAAILKMNNHVIICGYGRIGKKVAERLRDRRLEFVIIEQNEEHFELLDKAGYKYIHGDARDDAVLQKAGISNARAIVATLSSDADNVYVVLSARNLNKNLHIVARAGQMVTYDKLLQAGANKVISPYEIGAHYIASAVLRPSVIDFMEIVSETATTKSASLEIEEIHIPKESTFVGKTLRETDFRTARNIIVLAIKNQEGEVVYNPSSDQMIVEGGTLICIGYSDQLDKLVRDVEATQK